MKLNAQTMLNGCSKQALLVWKMLEREPTAQINCFLEIFGLLTQEPRVI